MTPNLWFTSDTHFGHANVIKYSKRPYASVEEMDQALIANWNSKVKPTDRVYHLGDAFFGRAERACQILDQLHGEKHLIYGNHDKVIKTSAEVRSRFVKLTDYLELNVPDKDASRQVQLVVLCHYAMIVWNKAHHGSWMLHGHSHGQLRYPFPARIMDVGVDPRGYFPISYAEVKVHMKSLPLSVHHGD